LLPAIERASGQASELALLGERLVKIECQSHSELPILEISGSDSVRRALEACGLLSAAQFLSQLLCRALETGHGSQTDELTEYFYEALVNAEIQLTSPVSLWCQIEWSD
jgi:hypothetical protein